MERKTSNNRKRNQKTKSHNSSFRPNHNDNALMLRPEYKGQPAIVIKMNADPLLVTTTVGAGFSSTTALQNSNIANFSSRFAAFTEFRVVKVEATARNFSSVNSGIANMWFTEDDASSPSSTSARDAKALQYNYANIVAGYQLSYVPHDPAQQTWNLVSTGNPIIGYFKHYTNITNFGCPNAATQLGAIEFVYTVQFRGLV